MHAVSRRGILGLGALTGAAVRPKSPRRRGQKPSEKDDEERLANWALRFVWDLLHEWESGAVQDRDNSMMIWSSTWRDELAMSEVR